MKLLERIAEKLIPLPKEICHTICKDSKHTLYMITIVREKNKKTKSFEFTVDYEIGHPKSKGEPLSCSEKMSPESFDSLEAFTKNLRALKGLNNLPEDSISALWEQCESKLP